MTKIRSASITVANRCAIIKTVELSYGLLKNFSLNLFCMRLSVYKSMFAVASSKTMILLRCNKARARHISCFYPTENTVLLSLIIISNFPGYSCTLTSSETSLSTSQISSSLLLPKTSKFSLIEPYSKKGVYGI